jgi:hypothetical protein
MAALLRCSPLGGIILGGVHHREGPVVGFWRSGVFSSISTTLSLNGMVQWGLDDGRAMMDLCRAVARRMPWQHRWQVW